MVRFHAFHPPPTIIPHVVLASHSVIGYPFPVLFPTMSISLLRSLRLPWTLGPTDSPNPPSPRALFPIMLLR
jgi:hypothetical protein